MTKKPCATRRSAAANGPVPRRAVILGIGTAVPHSVSQRSLAELSGQMAFGAHARDGEDDHPGNRRRAERMRRVFDRTGIARRGSVLQPDAAVDDDREALRAFYPLPQSESDRGPGTAARMDRYATAAPRLATDAVTDALGRAGVEAKRVTHLVTVSCTGFVAPGLDVALIGSMGLSPAVRRLHVGFMGCHAAFNALGVADAIVTADPLAVVVVCCVELCTLHFAYGQDPQQMVANALFADGAAAAVVGGEGFSDRYVPANDTHPRAAWAVHSFASLLVPDTLDAMTWRVGDHGFEMTLSAAVPALVERDVRPWCRRWLGDVGWSIDAIDAWAVHPGGPRVLTATAVGLGLESHALRRSRDVLARHGNMSSATILFILSDLLDDLHPGRTCVALGFGPGLMMEGMLLQRC
jgi:predicted naringenin-chalcone synthase